MNLWFGGFLYGFGVGLVVACRVEGEVAEEFSGGGIDDAYVEVFDEHDDGGSGVGSSDADVVKSSGVAEGDAAGCVDDVVSDSVVAFDAGVAWGGFGSCVVDGGGGLTVEGSVGSPLVVFLGEFVELVLEVFDGVGGGLGGQPLFEGLLESFDFPAGGRVVGSAVFLEDAQVGEGAFESVEAASATGESGGVDHCVVGEY